MDGDRDRKTGRQTKMAKATRKEKFDMKTDTEAEIWWQEVKK